jgi:hypothetical protein
MFRLQATRAPLALFAQGLERPGTIGTATGLASGDAERAHRFLDGLKQQHVRGTINGAEYGSNVLPDRTALR